MTGGSRGRNREKSENEEKCKNVYTETQRH